ncbi:MAG: SpoIID/LytB domain-containing protein [Blastocatellia bacterium]
MNISFRDSATGYAVPTSFSAENQKEGARIAMVPDAAGRGQYQLAAGRHNLEVAARGYRPLKTHFEIDPQTPLAVTVWLDPLEIPEELRPEVVAAKRIPGYTMLRGHVADAQAGRPLAGARIRLENAGVEAQTDERGYFVLYALAPPVNATEELPKTDHLVAEFAGFKTYRIANVLLAEGDVHFKIELEQGEGTVERDKGHKMLRSAEELKDTQRRPQESTTDHHTPQLETKTTGVAQATNVAVPTSIRVGFNCSCATCSTVQVYTLDTYVRLGLDDEWISSWNSNSLKAGAIAFRSYGAYHVYHPRNVNYDICSTTCCQVIDPNDSSANTDNATSATSGVIVVDSAGTEPFFAEYAAENNDNFCADGFTGSPSFNWPCMNDFVDAGSTFNGHGRGMCQWGTQRWAINQAKDWTWIVNHYYNDNGNPSGARSGVLQLPAGDFSLSATPSSRSVRRNQSTSYTVTVTPVDGFTGAVAFSVTGLPGGASVSFNPTSVTGSGTTTMTVAASNSRGTFTLTITGTSGSLQHSATVTLTVTK